jgi:hypothetical protein
VTTKSAERPRDERAGSLNGDTKTITNGPFLAWTGSGSDVRVVAGLSDQAACLGLAFAWAGRIGHFTGTNHYYVRRGGTVRARGSGVLDVCLCHARGLTSAAGRAPRAAAVPPPPRRPPPPPG